MNKRKVDELIEEAYCVLDTVGIAENDVIDSTWSGYISSFGASVAQGSLLAAISFFNKKSESTADRSLLIQALFKVVEKSDNGVQELLAKDSNKNSEPKLFQYVQAKKRNGKEREAKENIINAAIALKLAMNLYDIRKEEKKDAKSGKNESQLSSEPSLL